MSISASPSSDPSPTPSGQAKRQGRYNRVDLAIILGIDACLSALIATSAVSVMTR